jgi:hypothetical protein
VETQLGSAELALIPMVKTLFRPSPPLAALCSLTIEWSPKWNEFEREYPEMSMLSLPSMPKPWKYSMPSPPPSIAQTPEPSEASSLSAIRSHEPRERSVVVAPLASVSTMLPVVEVTCAKTAT